MIDPPLHSYSAGVGGRPFSRKGLPLEVLQAGLDSPLCYQREPGGVPTEGILALALTNEEPKVQRSLMADLGSFGNLVQNLILNPGPPSQTPGLTFK